MREILSYSQLQHNQLLWLCCHFSVGYWTNNLQSEAIWCNSDFPDKGHPVVINPDYVPHHLTPFFLRKYHQPAEQIAHILCH